MQRCSQNHRFHDGSSRRYWLGLQNLFSIYAPIVDYWSLYDNSITQQPIVIANEIIDSIKLSQIKQLCQNKKK